MYYENSIQLSDFHGNQTLIHTSTVSDSCMEHGRKNHKNINSYGAPFFMLGVSTSYIKMESD